MLASAMPPLFAQAVLDKFPKLNTLQCKQLTALYSLYEEWNNKINVISRKDFEYFYERHVWHSLFVAECFNFYPDQKVVDIGTGGGFPGIPLAIAFPKTHFFLIDSVAKKIRVVNEVVEKLQLHNVTTICNRVENINLQFDTLTARAVVDLKTLCSYAQKVLYRNATFDSSGIITLKGGDLAMEIQNACVRPKVFDLHVLSGRHPYFENKYTLFLPRKKAY